MASVDGLISGLNTTDIIKQLMQLERQPQVRLQTKQAAVESAIGSLRALNSKFLAVTSAAAKLNAAEGWQLATATSSDTTKVAVTATAGAAQGSLSFNVKQLAAAGSYLSTGSVASHSAIVAPANTTLYVKKGDGTAVQIASGDGSLATVMKAINASGAGVSATAVQLTPGQYSLKLDSTTTGLNTAVTVGTTDGANDAFTTSLGGFNTLVAPADAQLSVNGSIVTRPSNTISDLLTGVTLTVSKADTMTAAGPPPVFSEPPTTVSVKADNEKVAAQVAALVEAVNSVNADIKAVTGYNTETGNKGKLYGDAGVRSLRDRLISSISGVGTAAAGVSIDRNGVATFDKAAFLKALEADPAAVQTALGQNGLAGRLHAVADGASRSKTSEKGPGLIAGAISSRETQISSLKTNISSWDNRLELRERTLQRTYAALETALGASKSQGQWLSGQIAGLPSWGS